MGRNNDSWGIEVGSSALKAVRLLRKGGEVILADYDVLPFKKVLTTPDLNVDEAIQIQLDQFLSRHDVSGSTVFISVPGGAAFARFAKLPPVEPKKIPDIVKFEAVQQIPFPIDQVEWDYQVFAQPDSPDVEVGIVAITKEKVAGHLMNYQAVGMPVDGITISPMAVYNAFVYDHELTPESPGMIIMDVGTTSTDVIIVENGQLWLRTLTIGGNHFTDALVRAFKLSFSKAEKLKREAGTSKYARQIFQAMRPVFSDLLQEMQRSLGYYQSLNRDAKLTKLVGVGSTFRLPGMQKFLKQQLQIDVVRLDEFKRISAEGKEGSEFAEHTLNLATAYGLALQGLGVEAVSTNILPRPMIRARLWRDKRPWFGAAAGVMLAASGAAFGRLVLWDQRSYNSAAEEHDKTIRKVINDGDALVKQWKDLQGQQDPRPQMENLRSVLDYRDVFPEIMMDLDRAAKALRPQKPLLEVNEKGVREGADYFAIRLIQWDERRRLYIDKITTDYKFAVDPEIVAYDKAMSAASAAAAPGAGAAGAAPAVTKSKLTPYSATEASPIFTIRVTGMTPNKEGPTLLKDQYLRWLQTHIERQGRPYRLIALPNAVVRCVPMSEFTFAAALDPALAESGKGASGSSTGSNPFGGTKPPDASAAGDPKKPVSQATSFFNRPSLVAANEATDRGWRFEISWRIQLVKPDDLRVISETPAPAPAPAPGSPTGAPPSAPAAPKTSPSASANMEQDRS